MTVAEQAKAEFDVEEMVPKEYYESIVNVKYIPDRTPNDIYVYCYPYSPKELLDKCSEAIPKANASGVYIPVGYEMGGIRPRTWFQKIKQLKKQSKLSVSGVIFNLKDFKALGEAMAQSPGVLDSVTLELKNPNLCLEDLLRSPPSDKLFLNTSTRDRQIRYMVTER
eukprot:Trichotokara_eunicae@DN6758_c0_g1_i1.p1